MEVYEKRNDESQIDYIKRVTSLREEYDLSYSQWCTLVCGTAYSEDNARKAYYVVEKMLPLIDYQCSIDQAKVKKYNDLKSREIQISKEKEKLKDVKREYFNLVRNESRWEELYDTIMNKMEYMNYNHTINIYPYEINGEETEAILCLSDFHIGVEIDTPVNKYNIKIAEERVEKLIKSTMKYCKLNNVTKLHIVLCGDLVSGVIHISPRIRQNENVVSQVLIASELISNLIITLSQVIKRVEVYSANGNHGRVSANVKESIDEENFESFIYEYVKLKNEVFKNKERLGYNVHFNENLFKDIVLIEINDRRIALTHGHNDFKQLNKAKDRINQLLSDYRADELIIAHLHNVRMHDNVTVNGALSGSDDYAMSRRYNNDPAQILKIFYKDGSNVLCEIKVGRNVD